jgi:hypothetical protein
VNRRAACFEPLSLESLTERAALLHRIDTKYVVDLATLDALVESVWRDFLVLDIGGRRVFGYDTVYFDSPELDAYHAHLQGRRRRFKVRSRRYVDSDLTVFEVKLKGLRGATVKHQLPIGPAEHGTITTQTAAFASEILGGAYGRALPRDYEAALSMSYQRVTLASRDSVERMTWDFALRFDGGGALAPTHVIVETKSERGRGRADRALANLGVRPMSVSKYCAGIGLTRADVRVNPWAAVLRRYFVGSAPLTAATAAR